MHFHTLILPCIAQRSISTKGRQSIENKNRMFSIFFFSIVNFDFEAPLYTFFCHFLILNRFFRK